MAGHLPGQRPIGLAALTAVPAVWGATADPTARLNLTGPLMMSAGLGLTISPGPSCSAGWTSCRCRPSAPPPTWAG
jgi:hypothetical protein